MREAGRESYEAWARSRQQALVRTAYLLTGDFHRDEDLVQEAMVKAALRWDALADGNADAWVRTVVYRDHVSWWRRHRREVLAPPRDHPVERYDEAGLVLRQALAQLSARQRAVLLLRYVDVPGLQPTRDEGGYQGPALDPTGLSADGTRLALPQPDRVVVVDLTTGASRSYDLPGPHVAVVRQDADHLVVTEEGAATGRVLDLNDGTATPSRFTASTGFAPDGSWVTWGPSGQLAGSDGTRVTAEVANEGGLVRTSPLVGEEVAVGLGGHDLVQGRMTYQGVAGVPVVDRHTGALRAFLYTEGPETSLLPTYLLGLDGDTVTLAAGVPPEFTQLLVLRWNWRTGELTRWSRSGRA